jgi:hypothetical protein
MADTIYARRRGSKLEPCSLIDEEALMEFPENKDLSITIARTRSNRQHRFFWGLLHKVCENHETYQKPEQLLLWIKIRLGYVEEVRFHNEEVWWVAKSTSFNAMGQDEFGKFLNAALDLIVEEVIPGITLDELLFEVQKMVGISLNELRSEDNGMGK